MARGQNRVAGQGTALNGTGSLRRRGRFSAGQDRDRSNSGAGTGARAGLSWAGQGRAGQGRAGQDRTGPDRAGQESAGQYKGQCIRRYRTQRTAGLDERHDRVRDRADGRAERATGQGKGEDTVVGEILCRKMQA